MVEKTAIVASRLWVVVLLTGVLAGAGVAQGQENSWQPQALDWTGVYALRQIDPNLNGAAVRVGVICRSSTYNAAGEPQNDYQPNVRHTCLQNARLRFYDNEVMVPAVSAHSTAVCSILFGEDPKGTALDLEPFSYQGVLPAAEGHVYEFVYFLAQYLCEPTRPPVDVAVASFGWVLDDWWTRGLDALVDREGLVLVASGGNGTNASDPPFYPGAGPNAIGVGVVSSVNVPDPATKLAHFALAYPEESSAGPTQDGRCKPDVIAPGNCLVPPTGSDRDYVMAGNWSSFSAPVVGGVVGLLVQAARQDASLDAALSAQGGNCVLKSILMNSATKLPYWHKGRLGPEDDHEVPLDYLQGAGMVNAVAAWQLLKAGQARPGAVPAAGWDLNQLELGRNLPQVYRLTVEAPDRQVITATLVWNRHYSDYPFKRVPDSDSDLRLEVWAVDPANSANDLLLDYSDSKVDNVEHISIPTRADRTIYEIVVSNGSLEGPARTAGDERYGLAWTAAEQPAGESIFWHDLNADGIVDDKDFAILINNWVARLKTPQAYVFGDINMDGVIDDKDMDLMATHRNDRAEWRGDSATN
jgi:hypothetical protein